MGVSFELTDYQDMLRFAKDEKWNAPEDQAIRKKLIEMLKLIKTDGYQAERNILIDAWLAESAKGYALLYQAHQIDYDNLTRYIANDKEDAERIRTYHKVFVAFLSLDQVVPDTEHVLNRKPLPSAKEVENSTREIAILKFDIIGIRKAPAYNSIPESLQKLMDDMMRLIIYRRANFTAEEVLEHDSVPIEWLIPLTAPIT